MQIVDTRLSACLCERRALIHALCLSIIMRGEWDMQARVKAGACVYVRDLRDLLGGLCAQLGKELDVQDYGLALWRAKRV